MSINSRLALVPFVNVIQHVAALFIHIGNPPVSHSAVGEGVSRHLVDIISDFVIVKHHFDQGCDSLTAESVGISSAADKPTQERLVHVAFYTSRSVRVCFFVNLLTILELHGVTLSATVGLIECHFGYTE